MGQAWEGIDEGWKDLRQRMSPVGAIDRCDGATKITVRLNVGGSQIDVRRSILDGKLGSASTGWTLGDLFGASWDKRLPVDEDGRVVLDESPVAVKHLIHALSNGSSAAVRALWEMKII